MEYVYAALLLHKLGKPIDEAGIKKIIEATGANADEAKIKTLIASLHGVDLDKAMSEAVMMPMTAGGTVSPTGAEKKEEKKEERVEESAEGLSALFG